MKRILQAVGTVATMVVIADVAIRREESLLALLWRLLNE